eukprot:1139207-Pelagomonas_calceolata.AAC.3
MRALESGPVQLASADNKALLYDENQSASARQVGRPQLILTTRPFLMLRTNQLLPDKWEQGCIGETAQAYHQNLQGKAGRHAAKKTHGLYP